MNNRVTGRRRPGHTLLTGKPGSDIRQVNAHPGQGDTEQLAGVFLRPRRHSADGAIATPDSNARDRIDEMRKIWQPRRGFAGHLPREMTQIDRKIGPHRDNAREDVARLEVMLDAVGKMDLNRTKGPTGYYGVLHNDAIRTFQKDRGLKVDGEVFPGGETLTALAQNLEDKGKTPPTPKQGEKPQPPKKEKKPEPPKDMGENEQTEKCRKLSVEIGNKRLEIKSLIIKLENEQKNHDALRKKYDGLNEEENLLLGELGVNAAVSVILRSRRAIEGGVTALPRLYRINDRKSYYWELMKQSIENIKHYTETNEILQKELDELLDREKSMGCAKNN